MTLSYNFKPAWELARFGLIAGGVYLLQVVAGFEWEAITDWEVYARSVGIGAAQAVAAAILAKLGKPTPDQGTL